MTAGSNEVLSFIPNLVKNVEKGPFDKKDLCGSLRGFESQDVALFYLDMVDNY